MQHSDQSEISVTIQTGSRLHFGIFSDPIGKLFQGAGMMIDAPRVTLSATQIDRSTDIIQCHPTVKVDQKTVTELTRRIESLLNRFRERQHINVHWKIEVSQFIPFHNGLGSGTQLAMAVGKVLCELQKIEIKSPQKLLDRCDRGKRSSIGGYGFFQGGFLIDAGKIEANKPGHCIERSPVPDNWRVLLITPKTEPGLAGTAEKEAFKNLLPFKQATINQLNSLLEEEMLPAVQQNNLPQFNQAVFQFGQIVGTQFQDFQAGLYSTKKATRIVNSLTQKGVGGLGQTSWGPTLFAFYDQHDQNNIEQIIESEPELEECHIRFTKPKNHGAQITSS